MKERTLIILKPDAVMRGLEKDLLSIFLKLGNIIKSKRGIIPEDIARVHYNHVSHLPIFEDMIKFVASGEVIIFILEGEGIINVVREKIGTAVNPKVGTIREMYSLKDSPSYMNLVHASDSVDSAEIEIKRFFEK